jgi:hypothetical protein
MHVPILVEPVGEGRYRARAGEPFALSAEAESIPEALAAVERLIQDRLRRGARLVNLDIPATPPTMMVAGLAKEHPGWQEFLDVLAESRKREDAGE